MRLDCLLLWWLSVGVMCVLMFRDSYNVPPRRYGSYVRGVCRAALDGERGQSIGLTFHVAVSLRPGCSHRAETSSARLEQLGTTRD